MNNTLTELIAVRSPRSRTAVARHARWAWWSLLGVALTGETCTAALTDDACRRQASVWASESRGDDGRPLQGEADKCVHRGRRALRSRPEPALCRHATGLRRSAPCVRLANYLGAAHARSFTQVGAVIKRCQSTGSAHGRYVFTPGGANPNALQITVRRQASSANGAVPLLFPNMFGFSDFEFAKSSISTLVDVDIALVVDRSGSMAYAANEKAVYPPVPQSAPPGWFFGDPAPPQSRWRDLVGAADAFVTELEGAAFVAHVALVTYGNTASIDRAMHGDLSRVGTGLDVYTQSFNSGNTNIGDGIVKGESALQSGRDFASKVVVLMTDGIRTTGPDPVTHAKSLGDKGVIVFTVTFSDEADISLMQKVAEAGLGQHFHANNAATLTHVFKTIARTIPTVLTD